MSPTTRQRLALPSAQSTEVAARAPIQLVESGPVGGVIGAAALGRVLDTLLYEVQASDPLVLGGGALFFLVVALGASLIPAQRAARTAPAVALRSD